MAKKKKEEKDGERIEMKVPLGFTAEVDRVAKAIGVTRSGYIRMACLERMVQDRKRLGLDEGKGGA